MTTEIIDKDEVLNMARQAGFWKEHANTWRCTTKDMEAFAKLVAAKEREICAKLAQETICDTHLPTGVNIYGTRAAKAIRSRGEA